MQISTQPSARPTLKEQKTAILESEISLQDQVNLRPIRELIDSISDHMKTQKQDGKNPITWEQIIECVDKIQRQRNNDMTAESWMIDNVVNVLGNPLGNQFKKTVEKLATHRNHLLGSTKINWFGHTNFTNGIKEFLEMLKLQQEAIRISSETDTTKKRKAQDHFLGRVFFSKNHRIARESAKLIGNIGCDEGHLAEKFLDPFACYIPSFRDEVRAVDKSEWIFGAFKTDPKTRLEFYKTIKTQKWENEQAQENLAKALRNQISSETEAKMRAEILNSIEFIPWTSPVAFIIAKDVLCRYKNDVIKPTFVSYIRIPDDAPIFLGSKDKSWTIIHAIKMKEFGTDPKTLLGLAKLVRSLSWEEEKEKTENKSVVRNPYHPHLTPTKSASAQTQLAQAIRDQAFGTDPETLAELWTSIQSITWTDTEAQKILAQALVDQLKAKNQVELKKLFLEANEQQWSAEAIKILSDAIQLTPEEKLAGIRSTSPDSSPGLSTSSSSSSAPRRTPSP